MKKQSRNTLPKEIRSATPEDALYLAWFGRRLSEIERAANLYLWFMRSGPDPVPEYRATQEELASDLLELVLKAVDERKGEPLRNLAAFIENWQPDMQSSDRFRHEILMWKDSYDRRGERCTLKHLSKLIRWPDHADLSQLSRVAKDLKFPLRTS